MTARDGRGRFQPGQSGNPAGRPAASGIKDQIYAELALPHGTSGQTRLEAFARRLVDLCIEGDVGAMRLLLDRGWPARLELQHDGDTILRVVDRSDARRHDDLAVEPHEPASDERPADPASLDLRSAPRDLAPAAPMPAPVASTLFLRPVLEDVQTEPDL